MRVGCLAVVVTILCGCSCNTMPQFSRSDLENATFECYLNGECERSMKWSGLPRHCREVLLKWTEVAPANAHSSLSTYAPVVVIRSKKMNVNFTMGLVVSNCEDANGKWKQVVRNMNEQDEEVRDNIINAKQKK